MSLIDKRNLIAQWAFDTRPMLLRFHLWLDDVEVEWARSRAVSAHAFTPGHRPMPRDDLGGHRARHAAVRQPGEGAEKDKAALNQVKKDADAISAYAMSESLWYLTRQLPENHAVMVCLGEGLMPKAGETPEDGVEPADRVRPRLRASGGGARGSTGAWSGSSTTRPTGGTGSTATSSRRASRSGARRSTRSRTRRASPKGSPSGPMTVLHLFNQPLHVARPYEGYVGMVVDAEAVVQTAADHACSSSTSARRAAGWPRRSTGPTPASRATHPRVDARRQDPRAAHRVAVEGVAGARRARRRGRLDAAERLPAFTESGTYAPTFRVGTWKDAAGRCTCSSPTATRPRPRRCSRRPSPMLDVDVSMALFSPDFEFPCGTEGRLMALDPDAPDFDGGPARRWAGGTSRRAGPSRTRRRSARRGTATCRRAGPSSGPTTSSPRSTGACSRRRATSATTRTPERPASRAWATAIYRVTHEARHARGLEPHHLHAAADGAARAGRATSSARCSSASSRAWTTRRAR